MVPGCFLLLFKVPGGFYGSRSVFYVFSMLHGFHGSRRVLRVIHGSRSVFIFPGLFFMAQGGFFMVPGWFIRFFKVPGWLFMVPDARCLFMFFYGSEVSE